MNNFNGLNEKEVLESRKKYGTNKINNNFNYQEVLKNQIDTKISVPSIGDIILNDNNKENFFTNTGTNNKDGMIYTINKNGTLTKKNVTYNSNIVPCININKNILTKGNGTLENPYEME